MSIFNDYIKILSSITSESTFSDSDLDTLCGIQKSFEKVNKHFENISKDFEEQLDSKKSKKCMLFLLYVFFYSFY